MSYTFGSGNQLKNDSSVPLHRIARRGNLASHMSKVCKEKIDAFQAKLSKVEKTRHEPRQKYKWMPKQGGSTNHRPDISNGKKYHISKMKAKLLKHNPKNWKITPSKHGPDNTETNYMEEEALIEKDPLALDGQDTGADEVISVKKEPVDDNAERAEADVSVKEEPMDDIPENSQDDSAGLESLTYIENDKDYMEEEALIEKDPLALDGQDTGAEADVSVKEEPMDDIPENYMEEEALIEKDPLALDGQNTDFYEEKDPLALDIKREDDPDSSSVNNNDSFMVKLSNIKVEEDQKHCIYCGFSTTSRKKLVLHMKLQHFSIESCVKSNFSPDSFHQFQQGEDSFYCPHCSSFTTKDHTVLRNHIDEHENKDSCLLRSDEVKSKKMRKINKKHRFYSTQMPIESLEKNSLVICPYCEFRTDEPQKILSHLFTEHKKNLSCSLCSYQTLKPDELKWHINHKHVTLNECTYCDYKTDNWLEFQKHTITKHIVYCPLCKFKTNKVHNLEHHIMFRHASKIISSFLCKLCSKFRSDDAREMVHHIITEHETEEELYRNFRPRKYKDKLLKELLRASLKVVHKCRYCFFESIDVDGYLNHLALNHMTKPPIQCVYCEFTAYEFIELAQHIADERLKKGGHFFCNKCHYYTTNWKVLRNHLDEGRHISKEYCSFCNFSTCHLELLNLHIQTKHKKTFSSHYQTESQNTIANQSTIEIDDSSQNHSNTIDRHLYNVDSPMVEYVFNCSACNLFTSSKLELLEHIDAVHKGKTINLTQAVQDSLSQETQQLHSDNQIKEYEDVLCCSYCKYKNTDFTTMKLHITFEHNEKVHFYCKFSDCNFMSAHIEQLKHHIKTIHVREMFSCILCRYSIGAIKVFEEHMKLVHNLKLMFTCYKCFFKTKEFQTLQSHVKAVHENNDIISISFPNTVVISNNNYVSAIGHTKKVHTCLYCHFYTSKSLLLSLHVSTKHKGLNIFFCNYCEFYFSNFDTLEKHVSTEHSVWRQYNCPLCSFNSWILKELWEHATLDHEMNFLFECSYCTTYRAETSEELQEHVMKEHRKGTEIKKSVQILFSCPFCNNYVSNERKLLGHTICEHTTVDLLCSYCSFKTNKEGLLQYHSITKHKKGISIGFCSECDFYTCDFSKLRAHLVEKHGGFQENNDKEIAVINNYLYKSSNDSTNLQEEFYFVCFDCDYKTTATNEYYQHILMCHVHGISSSTTDSLTVIQNKTVNQHSLPPAVISHKSIRPNITPEKKNIMTEVEKAGENKIKFCSFCDFGTDDLQELQKHYRSEHSEYSAPLSAIPEEKNENNTSEKSILSSPKTIHKFSIFSSPKSGHKLSILSNPKAGQKLSILSKPKTGHNPIILKNISSFSRREDKFTCSKCGLTGLSSVENLKSHMEAIHKVVFYFGCKVHNCKFKTIDKNLLHQHVRTSHVGNSSSPTRNKTPAINLENTELQTENSGQFKAVIVNPGYSILKKPNVNENVIASPKHPAEAKNVQYTIMLEHNGIPIVSKSCQPQQKSHVVMRRSTSSSSLQNLIATHDPPNISVNKKQIIIQMPHANNQHKNKSIFKLL